MTREEYLNNRDVKDFIAWMYANLIELPFPPQSRLNFIYNKYKIYNWGKKNHEKNFEDTENELNNYSDQLKTSLTTGDIELCETTCKSILDWGGVLSKNKKQLLSINKKEKNLFNYLTWAKEYLNQLQNELPNKRKEISDRLRMNAGFTKIYSLLLDDFIIYDGRVGGALGYLVREFCKAENVSPVPNLLKFPWGMSQGDKNNIDLKRRNPSIDGLMFPALRNDPKMHTEHNIRANWICQEIMKNTKSQFDELDEKKRLRAFEAALFMIGYDIKKMLIKN